MNDWLAEGLDGRSEETVKLNRNVLKPVVAYLGDIELRRLTAHDVRRALTKLASGRSSRTVVVAHNALTRAIRHAEANRHVLHNVAALVDKPKGQKGRPSRALTGEQAASMLKAAEDARLGAYVVLCLLTGIRTEEAARILVVSGLYGGDPRRGRGQHHQGRNDRGGQNQDRVAAAARGQQPRPRRPAASPDHLVPGTAHRRSRSQPPGA